jgi:hypothetical protein
VGKSRLLLEFGLRADEEKGFRVLWGNVETMAEDSNWLSGIVPDLPTLLLLDEPSDGRLIPRLAEQMRGSNSRMSGWKAVIATRSPKDPVLRAYYELPAAVRADPLELPPIPGPQSHQLVMQLLQSGPLASQPNEKKAAAAAHIANISGGIPVWMELAVKVLETTLSLDSLPGSVAEIARKYVDEVIEFQPERIASRAQIETLVRWLALYRRVNTEDVPVLAFLTKRCGFTSDGGLKRALHSLITRKVVISRGVNGRLHEIKPDVINDFILSDWLTLRENGAIRPSPDAEEVVSAVINGYEGKPLPDVQEIVRTLARVELKERLQQGSVRLLDPLVNALLAAVETESLKVQETATNLLAFFSFARVADTVKIIEAIRTHPQPDLEKDTILFGTRTLTHREIVSMLAWQLFTAGPYAEDQEQKSLVLNEMVRLFYEECRGVPARKNDGKRVADLIPRLASGGRGYSYNNEVYTLGSQMLAEIRQRDAGTDDELNLARVVLHPFLVLERSQTDFSDNSFTTRNWYIGPTSREAVRRSELRDILRVLTDSTKDNISQFAWRLLQEAHGSANRARLTVPDVFDNDVQNDLLWVKAWIDRPNLSIASLQRARSLWDWHAQFEQNPQLKQIADECEAIYSANGSAREFDVLFDRMKLKEVDQKAAEYGEQLRTATQTELEAFVQRAEAFAGPTAYWGNFLKVAPYIADAWTTNPGVSAFVRQGLGQFDRRRVFDFAMAIWDRRLMILRQNPTSTPLIDELEEKWGWLRGDDSKAQFLFWLYSHPHPLNTGLLTSGDVEFTLGHLEVLKSQKGLQTVFRVLSGMFHADWEKVSEMVLELWSKTPSQQKAACYFQLVDGISFVRLFRDRFPVEIARTHFDFLLDLLLQIPDIDELQGHGDFELEQMRDAVGLKPLSWLSQAFRLRADLFDTEHREDALREGKIVPSQVRLSKFVERISSQTSADPAVCDSVADLLSFNFQRNLLGYHLPEYLADIDPEGWLVPELVVQKIASKPNPTGDDIYPWSRFAASYFPNSDPWRLIAAASTKAAADLSDRSKTGIYLSLESGIRSSSYPSGEMDPQPKQDLEECIKLRDSEKDANLAAYRDWKVRFAQAHYDQAVAEFREERGE